MIDPGHPFSVAYADVIAALEDRLRHGTEQPATFQPIFQRKVTSYELPREATAITSVAGLVDAVYTQFHEGADYRFAENRLIWLAGGRQPKDATRVDVAFTYRERRSGLSDFNEGSVSGTLVRAVAREMTAIYDQMDQAYRRAFIDGASGVGLDSVVALLGVTRIPTIKARGAVTYLRQSATTAAVKIPAGSRVADQQGRTFLTLADASIQPVLEEVVATDGVTAHTTERIAGVMGVWPATPVSPPPPPLGLAVAGASPFGADERTIRLAAASPPIPSVVRVRYSPKSVTVEVEAALPGPQSNVNPATVIVMPTPPSGVTGVVNEKAIVGGRTAEADDRLRERAKHALERAGNATLGALRFAVLGVEGVDEAEVVDYAADSSLPPGEVRLRYSGTDRPEVRAEVDRVIDQTRAAGVRVTRVEIQTILVSGRFVLIPGAAPSPGAAESFRLAVRDAMMALPIGAPLQARRLNALAFNVGGLADVAEAQLSLADGTPLPDPFVVDSGHVIRPDPDHLDTVLLARLGATAKKSSPPATTTEITLQLLDAPGNAVQAHGPVTLGVTLEISAILKTSATRAPEIVGTFTRPVTFAGSTDATLSVGPSDAPDFRPLDHAASVSVKISAGAYPGLTPATTSIELA